MAEEHGDQNKVLFLSNSPYTGKKHLTVFCAKKTKLGLFWFISRMSKRLKTWFDPRPWAKKESHLFILVWCFSALMFCLWALRKNKRDLSTCVSVLTHRWQDWESHDQRAHMNIWIVSSLKPHMALTKEHGAWYLGINYRGICTMDFKV